MFAFLLCLFLGNSLASQLILWRSPSSVKSVLLKGDSFIEVAKDNCDHQFLLGKANDFSWIPNNALIFYNDVSVDVESALRASCPSAIVRVVDDLKQYADEQGTVFFLLKSSLNVFFF
jgi:hypothetical protein